MKQIIYFNNTNDYFYMTSEKNYHSYIQDPRKIYRLENVKTIEDVHEAINNFCRLYNDQPENYEIIL